MINLEKQYEEDSIYHNLKAVFLSMMSYYLRLLSNPSLKENHMRSNLNRY